MDCWPSQRLQPCACLRDIRSITGSGLCGLRGIGGISGTRNATRNRQASSFANDAAAMTIPEKPKSPETIAADKNSKDQCCIVFRMAFAQRNRRVLRLVPTAITTKEANNMVVVANVRLAISMSDSRGNFLAQHKFEAPYKAILSFNACTPRVPARHLPSTIKSISTTTISPKPVIGFSLNSLLFGQRGRLPSSATIKRKAKTTVSIVIALSQKAVYNKNTNILLSRHYLLPYGESPSLIYSFT